MGRSKRVIIAKGTAALIRGSDKEFAVVYYRKIHSGPKYFYVTIIGWWRNAAQANEHCCVNNQNLPHDDGLYLVRQAPFELRADIIQHEWGYNGPT